ncbi:MAG: hypothetical protein JNM62_08840 [Flavobacteriales bacterium]|nr:hypothetical protein [Flavobacteriales bacterium]
MRFAPILFAVVSILLRTETSAQTDSSAIRLQLWSADIMMESLAYGSAKGFSTFFKDANYLAAIQPKLDSLANALKGRSHRPCLLAHRSYGDEQRVLGRIADHNGHELAAVVFEFETADETAKIFRLTIMQARLPLDEEIEEPPPTQEQLIQTQPKR